MCSSARAGGGDPAGGRARGPARHASPSFGGRRRTAAQEPVVVCRTVRQVRSRPAAARLQGLPRGLRDLPRPPAAVVPQPRRAGRTRLFARRRSSRGCGRTHGPRADDDGKPIERGGRPADRFPPAHDQLPRRNAAGPVGDRQGARLSSAASRASWSTWSRKYQEQGADYIVALLKGYENNPPAGVQLAARRDVQQILPRPRHRDAAAAVGQARRPTPTATPATVDQYAKDVTAFLAWTAEPQLEERKRVGLQVMIFLIVLLGAALPHQEEGVARGREACRGCARRGPGRHDGLTDAARLLTQGPRSGPFALMQLAAVRKSS